MAWAGAAFRTGGSSRQSQSRRGDHICDKVEEQLLPNDPENLVMWIQDPKGVHGRTGMPDSGVTEPDARDIAAYLYTLRRR